MKQKEFDILLAAINLERFIYYELRDAYYYKSTLK